MTVHTFICQQSLVCSSFYDRAFVHYYYFICISNSGKPVCNNYRSAVFHQFGQGFLHHLFAFSIQGGRRFIQDQDRRVFQHGPRNGNALPCPLIIFRLCPRCLYRIHVPP